MEKNQSNIEIKPETIKDEPRFELEKHIEYFKKCLDILPYQYTSIDTNRMTLIYFILSSLDLMGKLDKVVNDKKRKDISDWVYAMQIRAIENDNNSDKYKYCGFRGSPCSGVKFNPNCCELSTRIPYDQANIAMTYTALLILILLKDDFSRLDKNAILGGLKHLQQEDGSFIPVYGSKESDMRFTFCAIVICYLLNNFDYIDKTKAIEYIIRSQTYDYAISQGPNQESHGGSTYCGLASLYLLDKMDALKNKDATLKFCLSRQNNGFHGRLNKPDDTCYSFWIGSSITMLDGYRFVNHRLNQNFLFSTQTKFGGFSKYPGGYPDILHSYMGIAGLALMEVPYLKYLHPAINISFNSLDYWRKELLPKF